MIGLASACKTYAIEYCRTDVDIRTDLLTQSGHSQHLFATYALRLKVEPLVVGCVPCPFVLYACPIADIRSINCIHLPVFTTRFEVAHFDSTMQRQKLRGGNYDCSYLNGNHPLNQLSARSSCTGNNPITTQRKSSWLVCKGGLAYVHISSTRSTAPWGHLRDQPSLSTSQKPN